MRKLLFGFITGITLASGVALASIPDPSGVIHGCYKTSNPAKGALIVVDSPSESCPSGTVPLDWNQIGPTGSQGPTGATGSQGPEGPPGPSGSTVTRLRGSVVFDLPNDETPPPLEFTWTQEANAVAFMTGSVVVDDCSNGTRVTVVQDGETVVFRTASIGGPETYLGGSGRPTSFGFQFPQPTGEGSVGYVFEPGMSIEHTVSVTMEDSCPSVTYTGYISIDIQEVS